jgi:hypothetical protein
MQGASFGALIIAKSHTQDKKPYNKGDTCICMHSATTDRKDEIMSVTVLRQLFRTR